MKQINEKIKYILYARKSSEEDNRQMLSLDAQENVLKDIAVRESLHIVEVLREAHSAKEPDQRPIFSEMVKMIKAGKANGILCWKMDRLARNPVDEGLIKYLLQSGRIQQIKTPERNYQPEDNALIASVEFGMANQYIRDLSTNVKRGLHEKAKRGLYPAFAPLGYLNNPYDPKGFKKLIKDPIRFEQVRKIFDLILGGNHTPVQAWRIARNDWKMTNSKGKSVSRSTIYRILINTLYAGIFEYPVGSGEWHKGKHSQMITLEEYDKVQNILGKKGKPRQQKHIFSFTGVIRCGSCGAMVTAQHTIKKQKNGNIHRYIYYRCTKKVNPHCTEKCVEEKILKEQIAEKVRHITIPVGFHAWGLAKIKRDIQEEERFRDKIAESKQQQYDNIEKQISKLLDLLTREVISEKDYQIKYAELNKKRVLFDIKPADSEDIIQKLTSKGTEYFDFCRDALSELEKDDPEKHRRIVSKLGSNLLLKDRIISFSIKKALKVFEELSKEVNQIHTRLKPPKNGRNGLDLELAYAQSSVVRRRWDSNPRTP